MTLIFPNSMINTKYSFQLNPSLFIIALLFLTFNSYAQVGINTTSPTTTLDVNGALSLRESPRPIELGDGINEDIELVGETPYSQYIIEGPATAFSIDGIKFVDYADGQIVRLINTTDQVMTIVHNNGDGLKIVCPSEKNLVVGGKNSSVTLQYSKGLRKWTVFGYASKQKDRITVFGTTDIARQNSSWASFDGLNISFTPVNEIIYIAFNANGSTSSNSVEADFRLLLNNTFEIPYSQTQGVNNGGEYQVSHMFPMSVTPGVQITISAQWSRNGILSQIIRNNPETEPSHGRFLTIFD